MLRAFNFNTIHANIADDPSFRYYITDGYHQLTVQNNHVEAFPDVDAVINWLIETHQEGKAVGWTLVVGGRVNIANSGISIPLGLLTIELCHDEPYPTWRWMEGVRHELKDFRMIDKYSKMSAFY